MHFNRKRLFSISPADTIGLTRKASTRYGFTLVELLVSIAIIAIMAAIIFPVFAQAREKAKQVTCMSNLRQIGIATLLYTQDYDETVYPENYVFNDDGITSIAMWYSFYRFEPSGIRFYPERGLLQPYMKNVAIQDCLSAADIAITENTALSKSQIAYALNNDCSSLDPDRCVIPVQYPPNSIAVMERPAETVLMADGASAVRGVTAAPYLARTSRLTRPQNTQSVPTLHGRHSEFANVLWCDGHVKAVKPIYRTIGGGSVSAQTLKRFHLGDLQPLTATTPDDYYFRLKK